MTVNEQQRYIGKLSKELMQKNFVPSSSAISWLQLNQLTDFIKKIDRLIVITGAGLSTESGIPDYRSPNGSYSKGHKPITYQEFVQSLSNRQRYWARSILGYKIFLNTIPNRSHNILSKWEKQRRISYIITQNVDRLHQKAGSNKVVEIHGHVEDVYCIKCKKISSRLKWQQYLAEINPWILEKSVATAEPRPDADAEIGLTTQDYANFKVPNCSNCGEGIIKPIVVFFGENVPVDLADLANKESQEATGVLVLGTSLQTFSSYRFVNAAKKDNKPVAIINIGPTRGDIHADLRIDGNCGEVLENVDKLLNR